LVDAAAGLEEALLLDGFKPPIGLSLGIDADPGEMLGACANADAAMNAAAN